MGPSRIAAGISARTLGGGPWKARVRHRGRLLGHRGSPGAPRAGHPVRLLRGGQRGRRQLALPQRQRHVLGLPVAAHQHVAAADGVPRVPDAGGPAGLPEPLADRRVLRRLRRPLRLPRQDHVPHRGGQGRAAGRAAGTTSRCGPATSTASRASRRSALQHVVVANGHHWDPRWPEPSYPGAETFPGEQMHAHYYRTPDVLEGKRVLVLGIGNSATDIAVESSRVADETYLAMRRGAHIVPKYVFGVPTDHLTDSPLARGPLGAAAGMPRCSGSTQGRMTDYGLPQPDHPVLHAHPTVSDDLLTRLGHGDITVHAEHRPLRGPPGALRRRQRRRGRRGRLLHRLQDHLPVPRRRFVPRRDNHVDLSAGWSPRPPGPVLRRPGPAARRDHAAGRGAVAWVADLVTGEAALPSYDEMRRQIETTTSARATLRRLEAAHDPGRLPRLPGRDRAASARCRRSGPAPPHPGLRSRLRRRW